MSGTPPQSILDNAPVDAEELSRARRTAKPIERVFLGFQQPPLQTATQWLIDRFTRSGRVDMSDVLVVVPSARARTRLLQRLATQSYAAELPLFAPEVVTLGAFPEYCYPVDNPFATAMASESAWAQALAELDDDECHILFDRSREQLRGGWTVIARLVSDTHRRLANDVKSFRSVAEALQDSADREEAKRWEILAKVQHRYYQMLNDAGLWDIQAARNVAIRRNQCSLNRPLVLLGTADLNRSMTALLAQLETAIVALIAAPDTWSDRFDEFGNLQTERWTAAPIEVPRGRWKIVETPADQAFATLHFLSHLPREVAADEITVGVPDRDLVPHLERSFNSHDVPVRNLTGTPLADSPPYLLLDAVCQYLDDQYFRNYATLLRHPDLFHWISAREGVGLKWLSEMDRFQNDNLPGAIRLDSPQPFGDPQRMSDLAATLSGRDADRQRRQAESAELLNQVHGHLRTLLETFDDSQRPATEWAQAWQGLLQEIYGDRKLKRDDAEGERLMSACQRLHSGLDELQHVPGEWASKMTAVQTCRWVLRTVADERLIQRSRGPAVELAGWLDLALDDAPVMVVTGMNDESVPSSETAHMFLPNSLCERLGIQDNQRRFARDAYVLATIMASREDVLLVSGRKSDSNDPLKPSRLLFTCDEDEVVRRALAYFDFADRPRFQQWLAPDLKPQPTQALAIPHPGFDDVGLNRLSVTRFRDYLKCPYRFFLKHVLRLEEIAAAATELDQLKFGTLVHLVLERWGTSELKDSCDANEIFEFLSRELDEQVQHFADASGNLAPVIRVQHLQILKRLEAFAQRQVEWRGEGWEIVAVEADCESPWPSQNEFTITGKIDRIDRRTVGGDVQYAILDYKTSQSGSAPRDTHGPKTNQATGETVWNDLQLPLYRHLATTAELPPDYDPGKARLGYVALPKRIENVGFLMAEWDDAELQSADQTAEDIIERILNHVFWPPNPDPVEFMEAFAAICQDHVMERYEVREWGTPTAPPRDHSA